MQTIQITDKISYIPACTNPLSSDVGIIRGDSRIYLYDVGSTVSNLEYINSLPDDKTIIISHFHADHTWWLINHSPEDHNLEGHDELSFCYPRPKYSRLYVGKAGAKHTGGEIVDAPIVIDDGVHLEILPLTCSHCKGSLALIVNDEYAFIGDAAYATSRPSEIPCYNAQLLKEEIEFLRGLKANYLLVSHDRKFIRPKKVVLRQLENIYRKWDKSSPFIFL